MTEPWLTRVRWDCLQAFKRQPVLTRRPFLAKELITQNRRGEWKFPATGATMDSLRKAGFVRRVTWEPPGGLGFRIGHPPQMWELTDAGRRAVKSCPDTFPGDPVYGTRRTDNA